MTWGEGPDPCGGRTDTDRGAARPIGPPAPRLVVADGAAGADLLGTVLGRADALRLLSGLLATDLHAMTLEDVLRTVVEAVASLTAAGAVVLEVPAPGFLLVERIVVHRGLTDWELEEVAAHGLPHAAPDLDTRAFELDHGSGRMSVWRRAAGEAPLSLGLVVASARLLVEAATSLSRSSIRERWLEAVSDVVTRLVRPESAGSAIDTVCRRARETCGADMGWVMVRSTDGRYRHLALDGFTEEQIAYVERQDLATSLSAGVIRSEATLVTRGDRLVETGRKDLFWAWLGPAILVPARFAARVEGMLGLAWSPDRTEAFRAVEQPLVDSFAELGALAIHVVGGQDSSAELSVLQERDRVARELNEAVIERLTLVSRMLAGAPDPPALGVRSASATDVLGETIQEVRRTIAGLTTLRTEASLPQALAALLDRSEAVLGFRPALDLTAPSLPESVLEPALHADLLAVAEEVLSNVGRHARARRCEIRITVGDELVLVVADDGDGLPDVVAESGLANLRARARAHGGTLELASGPQGCTLTWAVPMTTHRAS